MPSTLKLAYPRTVVGSRISAFVDVIPSNLTLTGTATRTVTMFKATQRMILRKATWSQELAVDGTKTITVQNNTTTVNMTTALTINGLGALGSANFVLNNAINGGSDSNMVVKTGDVIVCVYTVTVAGSVAPSECSISLEFALLGKYN